jgi:hypothetical protein
VSEPVRKPRRNRDRQTQVAIYRPDRRSAIEVALIAARAGGCTCEPEIEMRGVRAIVSHDDWCALLRRGDVN